MSSISIKGIVAGNLCALALSLVMGVGLVVVLAVPYEAEDLERVTEIVSSGVGLLASLAISALIFLAAGYVAARVAGRGELINGALSSLAYVAYGLYGIASWPEELTTYDFVDLTGSPLLGLLGGYLRLKQRLRVQAS